MTSSGQHIEDRLLEFAYGELGVVDAQAVEVHLRSCTRCSTALASIQGVRQAMSKLAPEPTPVEGMESLLAYAQQAARRSAAGEGRARGFFWKWVTPLAGVTAAGLVALVAYRVNQTVSVSEMAAAELREKNEEGVAPERSVAGLDKSRDDLLVSDSEGKGAASATIVAAAPPPPSPQAVGLGRDLSRSAELSKKKEKVGAPPEHRAIAQRPSPSSAPASTPAASRSDGYAVVDQLRSRKAVEQAPKQEPLRDFAGLGNVGEAAQAPTYRAEAGKEADWGRATGSMAQGVAGGERGSLSLGLKAGTRAVERSSMSSYGDSTTTKDQAAYDKRDEAARRAEMVRAQLEAARQAGQAGNSQQEVRHALEVLNGGAEGYQRIEALKRLCDAYRRLGMEDQGERFCVELMKKYPSSGAAKLEQQRRSRSQERNVKRQNQPDFSFEEDQAEAAPAAKERPSDASKPAEAY